MSIIRRTSDLRRFSTLTVSLLLLGLFSGSSALPASKPASETNFRYFKSNRDSARFHIGVTGLYAICKKGWIVTVDGAIPGSPADGKFKKGDIIKGVNGTAISGNPWVALGNALTQAEAKDGRMAFHIESKGKKRTIEVSIPVLGAYSKTWPLNCKKSDTIIRQTAKDIIESGMLKKRGIGENLAALFLLSTGDDAYLQAVADHAKLVASRPERIGGSSWYRGYQGILLGEYYLRTGDKSILSSIKVLTDGAAAGQSLGGWCHGGLGIDNSGGYVQSGLVNSAGLPVLITTILAKECGVKIDSDMFDRALTFFFRYAGHSGVPYGDHRPGGGLSSNGMNGMLACALSLLDGEPYRKATEHQGVDMADSYPSLLLGHTGGGFDGIWRGLSIVHVPKSRQHNFRRSLDKLRWWYDLSRLPGGGFAMASGARYGTPLWGTGGLALAYTAPRRLLRITGAPRTKYSQSYKAPGRAWGNAADDVFLSTDHAKGFGKEVLEPHEISEKLRIEGLDDKKFMARMMRHYHPFVRTRAGIALAKAGGVDELVAGLKHDDARVRRAACDGISLYNSFFRKLEQGIPEDVVSAECASTLSRIIRDPNSAWWELDGALQTIGRAKPEDIRKEMPVLLKYSKHRAWYLREAAFWGIAGLRADMRPEEFLFLADIYARETQPKARETYNSGFKWLTKKDKLKLSAKTQAAFAKKMAHSLHSPTVGQGMGEPAVHEASHRTMMVFKGFKGFGPVIYDAIVEDFEKYLKIWHPVHRGHWHSEWLMSGSRWQPGMLKVLHELGPRGKGLCLALKQILANYDQYKMNKSEQKKADTVKALIAKAVADWEKKHGKAN